VRVWDLAFRRAIAILTNHADSVHSVAFSPGGDVLATASLKAVWLWDTKAFQPLRSSPNAVLKAKFSPDGNFLVTGATNGLILWDAHTWRALTRSELAKLWTRGNPAGPEFGLTFSPDSRRVAVASDEGIKLLSIPEFHETAILRDPMPRLRPIAFSPDGRTIAAAALGRDVKVWDVETRQQTNLLSGHSDSVFCIAFSPDGKKLVTGSADQMVKLWEMETGKLVRTFKGHVNEVWDVAFSPNGRLLASVSKDGAVKTWEACAGPAWDTEISHVIPWGFSGEGNLVAWTKGGLTAFDPESLQPVSYQEFVGRSENTPPNANLMCYGLLTVSRDGRAAITTEVLDSRRLEVWDLNQGRFVCSLEDPTASSGPYALRGHFLATPMSNQTVSLWQLPEGVRRFVLTNATKPIRFSLDGTTLATAIAGRNKVKLWKMERDDIRELSTVGPGRVDKHDVDGLAVSPDGRLVAMGEWGGLVTLWAAASGQKIATLVGHKRDNFSLAFRPDGRTLASICDDQTVRLWHVATWREMLKLPGRSEYQTVGLGIGFSPDGRTLVAERDKPDDSPCQVWYAPSFAEIAVAEGRDYRAEMGTDPAIWLATGKALAKRNRDTEALEVFTKVIQFCGTQPDLKPLLTSALSQRGQLHKQLGRFAEAGTDNCAAFNIPARDPRTPTQLLDLSSWLNRPLECENFSIPATTNYLEGLPHGLHVLPGTGAVRFDLRGVVRLRCGAQQDSDPPSAGEIQVRQKCRRLHFLQSAHNQEAEGAMVGAYVIRYEDGQRAEVPVRYGQHVRDWVLSADPGETPGAKVAWTGTHPTKGAIRIFEQTWENPRPEVEIATLDFVSKLTKCHPVLIAITAEP
jgi:WD40 repeat protein